MLTQNNSFSEKQFGFIKVMFGIKFKLNFMLQIPNFVKYKLK